MATAEQLAAFQTAVASGNIQEAANIAASAGYSPQQVAEYVNANAPILGLGPETGFSGVTAANLDPYFAAASAPVVAAPPPPVVVQEQGDPLKGALALYDQYLLAGQYPEAKALLDSTIATYGLNPTESYANIATYLNTEPKFEDVRKAAENKLFTSENIANFGKLSPAASVGPAGGIYQRTPQEQAAYASQLASIPVNTAVPLPVMPMSIGPSAAMARIQRTGEMTPEQYYSNIRESVSSGQYTPAQLRQMQQGVGASSQDINVAFGRGMTPITTTTPTMPGATADTTQSIGQFIQSRAPTTSVAMPTAPSMFSPENVRAQLELERLKAMNAPRTTDQEPVAGFAEGGLVSDDINRMLQNQRSAIQRESQSRQMLNTLGAPPVKKFSDGGPAGSSSGVRRLKMSGYQAGGDVTDEMFVGTRPEDFPETSPVDKKAGELLRALSEGTRGFVGAEPIEPGSEAYRTGQALANMPAVGVVAATAKGAGKSAKEITDFIKNAEGSPLVVYRGLMLGENTSSGALKGKGREGYASFGSSSPYVAASYGTPSADEAEKLAGTITPLLIKASKVVEFPVTTNRYGSRQFDKFEFDRRAQSLKPGEVLVARDVVDIGPRASTSVDPEKLYSYGSDIYAWGPETETVSAITKKAKDALKALGKKAEAKEPKAVEIKKSGKLTQVEKELLQRGGERQAKRLQRAADEIPGLEDQYQSNALIRTFLGRKGYPYQGVMTMRPGDFEKFAAYLGPLDDQNKEKIENLRKILVQGGSFDDVPFLMLDKKDNIPFIAGHEGRHRMRALGAANQPKSLVEVYPRSGLEMGGDDRPMKATEWLEKFNEALGEGRLVVPEGLDPAVYFDDLFKERLPDVYAKGGEVTNDEFIQEMMTGTRPSDFPETSPVDTAVSDYIKFQSKAVTDPKAYMQALGENIKKYHTDPLQQDPQKYLMEQLGPGQGLMGAIKPRGGIMPTTPGTPWGEYIDEVVGAAQKSYANIASDRREGVVDFIKKKLGKYIRSDFGTEEDPLRRAIESGRLETFGKDKDTFRSYALKAAREGDPDAIFDVTKAYDIGTGIRPTVMLPTRDFGEGQLAKQKAVDDLVSKIVAEGGDPEIARSIAERQLRSVSRDETDKALQTGEEGYSKVLKTFGVDKNRPKDMGFFERALDQGDIAYGKDFLNLQFLRPQDLAEALGAIPSNKLASMDFPEAVVEGNRLMKKSRDFDENIKIAEKGKGSTLPKETLFFGTKPLKTPAKSGQWINITDPDAARLEGALMRHSVHGYGKDGPYSLGGKQALLSGKANLFSLRDEKGIPMVTVEIENMAMQKMSDREARKTPDFKVRQVQGKFNSAPEDYIDDVLDLAETINGRWSEGPAGNQRYGRDRSGKDLDEPKIIEWGKLFANRKAQGKAAGGEITKFIKDNR